ncbi:MAG: MATE family efflux transporter [Lachnospiraceae bacterium]|nr:MATE family efflux transporter [Lachnospiraceae bacterium]
MESVKNENAFPDISNRKAFYKYLCVLVLPIVFQYFMAALVTASDAFMLGFLDQTALSSVSLAGQVAFVYYLFINTFLTGAMVLGAQYWGKKEYTTLEDVLGVTMRYTLLVGMAFTIASLVCPQYLMRAFTNDPELIAGGVKYLRMVAVGYVIMGFVDSYLCFMKICEKTMMSTVISSIGVIVNIILNGLLIFGAGPFPKMGIEGAALATVLSRILELALVAYGVLSTDCVKLRVRKLITQGKKFIHKDFWKYSLPVMINQFGWGGGMTMYSVIMGHLGSDATAANSIASIVRSLIASVCWALATGASIIIGKMLGAGKLDMAKKTGGRFVRLSLAIGVVSGLVILALIPLVLMMPTDMSDVAHGYLKWMLFLGTYYIVGNSLNSTVIGGIFPAGGDTKFGMICDCITLWCVVVPLGALAAFVWNLPVIAVAAILTLDEFVKIPAVYIHYKKYKWVKNITRDE